MKLSILLATGVLFCAGCSGPSLIGQWTVTPSEKPTVPTTVTATFKKNKSENQMLVYVVARPTIPVVGEVKIEADVTGTWNLEGDTLSVVATDTSIHSTGMNKDIESVLTKPFENQIRDAVTRSATGTIKFDGPDRAIVTGADGKTATLVRVKD